MKKWYVNAEMLLCYAIKLKVQYKRHNRLRMIEKGVQSVARNRETITE